MLLCPVQLKMPLGEWVDVTLMETEQTKAKSPSRLLPKTSVLSGQLEISCPFLVFSFGLSVYSSFSLQTLDYAAVDFERRNILC